MERRRESKAARRKRVIRNRLITAGGLLILIFILIIILVSYNDKRKNSQEPENLPVQSSQTQNEDRTSDVAVPDIKNDKPVNLYTINYGDMTCYKVTAISKTWSVYEDLESFGAFFSSTDSFAFSSETQAHRDTWNSIETLSAIKSDMNFILCKRRA